MLASCNALKIQWCLPRQTNIPRNFLPLFRRIRVLKPWFPKLPYRSSMVRARDYTAIEASLRTALLASIR
jgi:hypothetical protein